MAITNATNQLTGINPAYNPLVYGFDSTNKDLLGFRYVVDIYRAGTNEKIFEGKIIPRPNDGKGYIDISKIIANKVSFDVDFSNNQYTTPSKSFYEYDIKIGEEYIVDWEFDDINFGAAGTNNLVGSTAHGFNTNDSIIVSMDNPSLNPLVEGLQTVFSVTSTSLIIDTGFVNTPLGTGGKIRYSDNRKTVFRDLLVIEDQVAFNAAFSAKDWINYDSSDYLVIFASTTRQMLTNHPDNYKASVSQDLYYNVLTYNTDVQVAKFQNDNGDVFAKNIGSTPAMMKQVPCGPGNHGVLIFQSGSSTGGLIKDNTKYYDFWIDSDNTTQVTRKYRVYIDRKCGIEDYEILFLDRMGSFSSFNFPLRAVTTIKGKRTTYNKQVGRISANKWKYNTYDAGVVNEAISVNETIKLRTDWMTSEMAIYFQELVFSPVTYVKIDGEYYSCIINTSSYSPQSNKLKKLIKEEITITLSLQNNINI